MYRSVKGIGCSMAKLYRDYRSEEEEGYDSENTINNIDWGFVVINYEKLYLSNQMFFDDSLTICLPQKWERKSEEWIKENFTGETDTIELLLDEANETELVLRLQSFDIESREDIETIRDRFAEKSPYPVEEKQLLEWEDGPVAIFLCEEEQEDEDRACYFFYKWVKRGLLKGKFSCTSSHKSEWHCVILQMLLTIKEVGENREDG